MPSRYLKEGKGSANNQVTAVDQGTQWILPSNLSDAKLLLNSGNLTEDQIFQLYQAFPDLRHYYDPKEISQSKPGVGDTYTSSPTPSPVTDQTSSPTLSPVTDPPDGTNPPPIAGPVETPSPTLSPVTDPPDGTNPPPIAGPVETSSPTLSPQANCVSSGASFGNTEDGAPIMVPILLDYEIETNSSFVGNIGSEVLPPLESAMLDFLLPTFFPQECDSSNRNLRLMQKRSVLTNTEVIGISASPPDVLKGACTVTENIEGPCVVIESRMTLYAEQTDAKEINIADYIRTQRELVHSSICTELTAGGGALTSAHPAIVKLNCVNDNSFDSSLPVGYTDVQSTNPASSSVSPTNIVVASSAAVVFVVGIAAFRRHYLKKKDKGEDDDGAEEDLDDSGENNPSNSFGSAFTSNKDSDQSMRAFDQSMNTSDKPLDLSTNDSRNSNGSKNTSHENSGENSDLNTSYNSNADQNYLPSSLESPTGIAAFAKRSYYSSKDAPLVSSLDLSEVSSPGSSTSTVSYNDKTCLLP